MKKYILFLLVLLVFVIGCTQQVGEQGEDFFKDYLKKYLSEEYINEHFEITKTIYEPQYDQNCYTYEIKFGDQVAGTGSGVINEVEGIGGPGEIACFRGHKVNRYHGPKKEFELKITQEEAERIMQSNGCILSSFKDGTPALYIKNDGFWWKGNQELTTVCKVDAETGEFTTRGWETPD